MKGDKLFCITCEKYSVDTQDLYDSRNDGKPRYSGKGTKKERYVWNCPHCSCNIMVNVNQLIIDELFRIKNNKVRNNYKGSKLYHRFIKDWPELLQEQKALYSLTRSK